MTTTHPCRTSKRSQDRITVHLVGYLGCDPQHRLTRPATRTLCVAKHDDDFLFVVAGRFEREPEPMAQERIEIELTSPVRNYTVLSVATHHGRGRHRLTHWHRVVAWKTDRHPTLRWLHKGDQVEILGRPSVFRTEDGRELAQLELLSCRIVRSKPRDPRQHPRFGHLV